MVAAVWKMHSIMKVVTCSVDEIHVCVVSRMLLSGAGSPGQTVSSKASRESREPTGACLLV